jgi:hypothetical protein
MNKPIDAWKASIETRKARLDAQQAQFYQQYEQLTSIKQALDAGYKELELEMDAMNTLQDDEDTQEDIPTLPRETQTTIPIPTTIPTLTQTAQTQSTRPLRDRFRMFGKKENA